MNRLAKEKQVQIVNMLVEGNSLRGISRMTGCSINTVTKLLVDMGRVCERYHNSNVKNLKSTKVQCDEIWSFVYSKEKNVPDELQRWSDGAGDVWTWVSIDADSKLVISWLVADRGMDAACAFMTDVASRLQNQVQLSTDGHNVYPNAVQVAFGSNIDFAQLIKTYGQTSEAQRRYSPAECIATEKRVVSGNPDENHISTSYVERQNLTVRMSVRRFTRLTNAFSKKIENHCYALALHYMHYNFCRIHKSLRVTPAMEAGLTDDVWNIGQLVDLLNNQ